MVGESGKRGITFELRHGYVDMPVKVPCGKCVACKLERSRQWAMRLLHEASCHASSLFVTLTYDDAHLPPGETLVKRDLQLFFKRLRKACGPCRYYAVGEYGSRTFRPHYHALLFGVDFADAVVFSRDDRGVCLLRSPELESIWGLGFAPFGEVTFESAAYCARYCLTKEAHSFPDRLPEFSIMSRRPGIGSLWSFLYGQEVYRHDSCVVRGRASRPPRYYDDRHRLVDDALMDDVVAARCKRFVKDDRFDVDRIREQVLDAKLATKSFRKL